MLITIVDTKDYGKFVLHKYPYQQIQVEQQGFQKLPSSDILQNISDTFDYFAIYRKKQLITTSSKALPEKAVVEIFGANQKSSQIVLGIDDDCVLVSRSIFLNRRRKNLLPTEVVVSDSAVFLDYHEDNESIINSVSLVWRQQSFEDVQQTKHRLSFLLGVLEVKERHSNFLTKEIHRIMEENQVMGRRIRDLFTLNTRDNTQPFQQIRIKILAREIHEEAKRIRQKISLFRTLKEYYDSWMNGRDFSVKENDGQYWEGTIGNKIIIQDPPQTFIQQIEHKTLVIMPRKLAQYLPSVLYSDRVKKLYEKGFSFNNLSFKKLLQKNADLNKLQLYHTAYFLLRNNLAVDIYPINHPHSYNLYYLKQIPSRQSILKINQRIFPGKNCLEMLSAYSKYKIIKDEEEALKYFLSKDIVGQVKIYIYKKYEGEMQEDQSTSVSSNAILEQILNKYNMTDKDLNYLLAVEPYTSSSKDSMFNNISKFVKDHFKKWGFYFIQ